ncbi:hypothetical protein JCM25156A_32890 [Komagataeibacter kakiaceti JCM 25156]
MSEQSAFPSDRRSFLTMVAAILPLTRHHLLPETRDNPDAELIQASHRFAELEQALQFASNESSLDDDEVDRIEDEMRPERTALFQKICSLRACTWEGHVARAQAVRIYAQEMLDKEVEGGSWSDSLVWAVMRDMTADQPLGSGVTPREPRA